MRMFSGIRLGLRQAAVIGWRFLGHGFCLRWQLTVVRLPRESCQYLKDDGVVAKGVECQNC